MSSFTCLLLVVACAALLLVGCDAQDHRNRDNDVVSPRRRNFEDTSISLGTIKGYKMITLPVIHIGGPDVVVGFPDNCRGEGLELLGTEMIVSNLEGGSPVDLDADNANNPQSNVAIHCRWESWWQRCPEGVNVKSYQFCGNPLPRPTITAAPTIPTANPSTTAPPSSNSDSSSSSEE